MTVALPTPMDDRAAAAAFTVADTVDRVDTNPGDGVCATSAGPCGLRAAIQEANALAGPDTITLPAGTFSITIASLPDTLIDPANGDFDITGPLTITGAGPGLTIIDGGTPPGGLAPEVRALDRLFDVHPTAVSTTISGLTLQEGYAEGDGGAVRFGEYDPLLLPPNSGKLRLENVDIVDSYASGYGGGVQVVGRARLELVDSTLSGNGASAGGAAVNNKSNGTIVIENSDIFDNPGAWSWTRPIPAGSSLPIRTTTPSSMAPCTTRRTLSRSARSSCATHGSPATPR